MDGGWILGQNAALEPVAEQTNLCRKLGVASAFPAVLKNHTFGVGNLLLEKP
jgi:hypothetical protein